jgi:DNA-binding IclR family transcriptional regulator
MTPEIAVLRALLRLARRRTPATLDEILVRVGIEAPAARRALASLARAGLVHRTVQGPRLTLAGFAVAVAVAASAPPSSSRAPGASSSTGSTAAARAASREARAPARVVPLTRRRPAA